MRNNVLILSAGRRVELIKAFQKDLKKIIPNASIYTTDINPELSSACKHSKKYFKSYKANDSRYIDDLLAKCIEKNIGLIVPTIDTELIVLSMNKKKFENNNIQIVISSTELISMCRDKRKTHELFNTIGIDNPEIYKKESIKYPCFCKPYDGSSSIGAIPLLSSDDMTTDIKENDKNMFMELIPKSYKEYTIDAYYNRRSLLKCMVPRERIEVRSGEVSKGVTRRNFVYENLLDKLNYLSGAIGCITFQVFVNEEEEKIKGLEINPRFGGGFPLSYSAGAEYPLWLLREYLCDEEIESMNTWRNNLLMLRYDSKVVIDDYN